MFESLLGLVVGVGLAASCGFRVFVPMLVMSVAAKAGQLEFAEDWWKSAVTAFLGSITCSMPPHRRPP